MKRWTDKQNVVHPLKGILFSLKQEGNSDTGHTTDETWGPYKPDVEEDRCCAMPHTQIPQFSSVTPSCPTLCDPMDCSTPGFPVHHQLPELAQTHVHWVSDAIQPSHPLSSPSPPAFNLSQPQGLFQWVSSLHQVAKVLELQLQLQHQSFQWIFRTHLL